MTLKEAFEQWALIPRYQNLAMKSRDAVQKVLMKENSALELQYFTTSFAQGIFRTSGERPELKTKAASILVSILQWGYENGLCKMPTFTYEIANEPKEEPVHQDPQQQEDDKSAYGQRPVVQLDGNLKVVRRFASVTEAIDAGKYPSLRYYLKSRSLYKGYYFAYEEEYQAGQWKPKEAPVKPKKRKDAHRALKQVGAKVRAELKSKQLQEYEDEELKEELRRRGYTGEITKTVRVTLTL